MTQPTQPGKPVTWAVVSQQEGTQRTDGGQYMQGVAVGFRLSTGETGTVFLPTNQYTPENVRDAIQAKAAMMRRVSDLSGEAKP